MSDNKKFLLVALLLAISIVIFITTAGIFFWHTLSPEDKLFLNEIFPPKYFFVLCLALLLSLILAIKIIYRLYLLPLGKLVEDITLIQTVNLSHRVKTNGGKTVQSLAALINEGADRYEELNRDVKEKISWAKAQVEDEKNTFAAFISELSEGVVICNPDGRILLFNKQAKEFLTESTVETSGVTPYIGLGRSIFGLIDKNIIVHVLDDITAKLERQDDNVVSYFVFVGRNNSQLKSEAVPIIDANRTFTGFILIMYDITQQLETDNKVDILLKSMINDLRASIGGIRAAIETIIGFPEMEREQLLMFNEAIHKESTNLSQVIEKTELKYSEHIYSQWSLVQMSVANLLEAVTTKAKEKLNISVDFADDRKDYWVDADSYSIVLSILFMLYRINNDIGAENFSCAVKQERKFVNIDLIWQGKPVTIENLTEWGDSALIISDEHISHSLNEVLKYHKAEITPYSIPNSPKQSSLRILLPAKDSLTVVDKIKKTAVMPQARSGLYDFDLFHQSEQSSKLDNISLLDLSYTVFDTETTGLDPASGDEIISIGAVRIVNKRILYEEMIDQLVDPKRSIPKASIEIHGIQPEILEGQPTIDTVLPSFYQFAEETILVGHNVAFDMAMLKAKEKQTGIQFSNPVLDTLLLSAVVHPEQDSQTMEAISERLGISLIGRHSAFGDTLTTAEIFLKIIPLLAEKGIHTLREAREASQKTFYARLKY